MSQVFKWDVDKFYTYTTALLLQLSKNGGNNDHAFDNIYEILTRSPSITFNSEIVVFKQVNSSSLDVGKLLSKAREEYRALVSKGTWNKRRTNNNE